MAFLKICKRARHKRWDNITNTNTNDVIILYKIEDNVFGITGKQPCHSVFRHFFLQKICLLLAQRPLSPPPPILFLVRPIPFPIFFFFFFFSSHLFNFVIILDFCDKMYKDSYLHFGYFLIFSIHIEFCSKLSLLLIQLRLSMSFGICFVSSCLPCSIVACRRGVRFIVFSDLSFLTSFLFPRLQVRFFVVELL